MPAITPSDVLVLPRIPRPTRRLARQRVPVRWSKGWRPSKAKASQCGGRSPAG